MIKKIYFNIFIGKIFILLFYFNDVFFLRSNENVESPNLIPTRTTSSCGLTVIDHENNHRRKSHPTFQQTSGVATDTLLVMH